MKRHSFFCTGFWPMFILLTAALLFCTLFFKWRAIEQDVANNATNNFQAQNIEWASVNAHDNGRTVVIEGTAPSQEQASKAIELAKSAKGVHRVKFNSEQVVVPPKTPASLNAIVTQNSIVLRGTVKDQAAIDQLLTQANSVFGEENVLNKLRVGKNINDLGSYPGLFQALAGKGNSAPFSAAIMDNKLTLNGQVINPETKASIGQVVADLTQLPVDNQINVVLAPPVEPEPSMQEICLNLVQEVLRNGKINFATGKAVIKQNSFELLQLLADTAKQCPDSSFIIGGHTDSTGNLAFNNRLSEQRAQAVVNHLITIGLSEKQFKAVGFGPSQPIADNATVEGRAKNRRIEFTLQTKQNNTSLGETE